MNKVICVCYGKGGHQEQMKRLLRLFEEDGRNSISVVVITDSDSVPNVNFTVLEIIKVPEFRDKNSNIRTLLGLVPSVLRLCVNAVKVKFKYNPRLFITTGPGLAIIPAYVFKLFNVKIVAFESWSRFSRKSFTGRFLYLISGVFFVQNKKLLSSYKNAVYKGTL
ncbi:hypothetical protein KCN56_03125 [Photobacterium galatheae]|uniref:PssD/Cps14F family polysaccharide biosynthesis glycosyltransferase n=1 Tax=Photobacterium galatheae TaxID=1654360 RepID=UPI00202CDC87|nr:PssD/Cps14F family polysaccharide biosynthesis glycosyltransferase [Photobacterium galatheae]MCM0147563.1 hypothetical protein [Photobacterium galatheae]